MLPMNSCLADLCLSLATMSLEVVWGTPRGPPRDNMLKINIDACFNQATSACSSGIVVRGNEGKVISGITSKIYATSAFVAAALALREGISLAATLNLQSVVVESDCQDLIEACRGNIKR